MKTSFHRALIGSCAGVKIFEELRSQHWFRAFWHLVLLNLLCAVFTGIGIYWQWKPQINWSIAEITEQCGELKINNNGITPTKDPEKARSFIVGGPLAVTYVPVKDEQLPENFTQECNSGLIFSGNHLVYWQARSDAKYDLVVINGNTTSSQTADSPQEILPKMRAAQPLDIKGEVTVNHRAMQGFCTFITVFGVIALAFSNLFQIIIYIVMFSAVFALMHIGRPKYVKTMEMAVMAVYAGFPPMIIGTLARILRLPFLDFNMIYVLGMTFYLMFILNRLNRNAQLQKWQDDENKPL